MSQLSDTFDQAAPLLQQALDKANGEYHIQDIRDRVLSGDLQLWAGEGYAAVTEVLNYPQRRVVLVHLAAGELAPVLEAEGELCKFAKVVGATGIELIGRKGWTKVLKEHGYRESAVHLFKEV